MSEKEHLILIDGYGYVFRAYHSLPGLTSPIGEPVGAIYGFASMLLKLLSEINVTHIAVVLDSGGKNFRHEIYPDYKAHRPPVPEDLICQFPIIREVIHAFNLIPIEINGFEADDIIATFARYAKEENTKLTIISSDKDLMQLIEDDIICMYDPIKSKILNEKEVIDKFGIPPSKITDFLALTGDSSDNIPGVKGVGPKTAAELLQSFGSLENIYENLSFIKQEKKRQNLIDNKDKAFLSKQLVTLNNQTPITYKIPDLKQKAVDNDKLIDFFSQYGFKSLIGKIQLDNKTIKQTAKPVYCHIKPIKIDSIEQLKNIFSNITYYSKLYIDLIIEEKRNEIIALLAFDELLYYTILDKNEATGLALFDSSPKNKQISKECFFSILTDYLSKDALIKVSFDIKKLLNYAFINPYDDLSVINYILTAGLDLTDLSNICENYLNLSINDYEVIIEETYNTENIIKSIKSAYFGTKLYTTMKQNLAKNKLVSLYETIEKPLIKVLADLEAIGVKIDVNALNKLSYEFSQKITSLEGEIYKIAGETFNIGSPKQLGSILFEKLNIAGGKISKKSSSYITDADTLEELSLNGHIIADLVLEWRKYSKLKNTYTEALPAQINPKTGRVHTNFTNTVTSTGRLSSRNPNLQNIPIKTDEGNKIRKAFIAENGYKIISSDYSQIELRILAHIADVKTLKQAFTENKDIHTITASEIFKVPESEVDSHLRRKAKTINFGIIYGQSQFGLAKQLGIDRTTAGELIKAYFKEYPGIEAYMQKTKEYARQNGYVTTLSGRKCFVKAINDKNPTLRNFAERAAINAPIQGTAADIIKKAMIAIYKVLKDSNFKTKMILQVHDELLFESPDNELDIVKPIIKNVMENVYNLSVPLIIDTNTGESWGEKK